MKILCRHTCLPPPCRHAKSGRLACAFFPRRIGRPAPLPGRRPRQEPEEKAGWPPGPHFPQLPVNRNWRPTAGWAFWAGWMLLSVPVFCPQVHIGVVMLVILQYDTSKNRRIVWLRARSGKAAKAMTSMLITGGAGFIGSPFVRRMLRQGPAGLQVINLDLLTTGGNLENLEDVAGEPRYHFVKGDIRDKALVDGLFTRYAVDTVVHFAAESHVDRSIGQPELFLTTNTVGTQIRALIRKRSIAGPTARASNSCRSLPTRSMAPCRPRAGLPRPLRWPQTAPTPPPRQPPI